MNRMILIILLQVVSGSLYSQYFTRQQGNDLIAKLKSAKSDSMRIELLLKVAEYHVLSSYDHPANYDTATLLINQAESLNSKAKIKSADLHGLLVKSYFFRTSGKRDQGKSIILTAINLLKDGPAYTLLGQAYYELSNYYDYDFKYSTIKQRVETIEMAIPAFEKAGDLNDLGNCYKVMADLHHLCNEYPRAFSELETALQYYKTTHYKRMEGVYDLFGQLYYARGDYKQALAYELLALKTADSNNDAGLQLCEIENNVGLTFYKLNDGEAALKHFKVALEIAEKERDNETVYGLTSHVVETYINLNRPEDGLNFLKSVEAKYKFPGTDRYETAGYMYKAYLNLYTTLKQYDAGRYYCNQIINKAKAPGLDVFKLNGYYEEIIKYLTGTKEYPAALKYLNKNKELLEGMNDNLGLARNYTLWFSLDTAQRDFRAAVENLLKANLINDTILNETKAKEMKQLEVLYESEKKENNIRLKDEKIKVLVQTDLAHQANLSQARVTRNATLIAVLFLLALGSILFNQYKQKRKSNIIITQRNEQLSHLLNEKEWLLKEVNHRVRNNLHTIFCLLESQATFLKDDALNAIKNSQHRVYAMSLIHQKLYQTGNLKIVEMTKYLPEFIEYLTDSFGTSDQIHFDLQIAELKLDMSRAIPIALILNEAVTNSIKYAFPKGQKGVISIHLRVTGEQVLLIIADNGIGINTDPDNVHEGSLGLGLMRGLSQDIKAKIAVENDGGTKISVRFKSDVLVAEAADLTVYA